MSKKSWYEILGVTPNASAEEVKHAYRSLAKKYHPDIAGPQSASKMQEINDAKDDYLTATNSQSNNSNTENYYYDFDIIIKNLKQEEINRKKRQVEDKLFEKNFLQNLFIIVDNSDVSVWDFTDIYANVGNCFYSITSGDIYRQVNEIATGHGTIYSCKPAKNYVTNMQPLIFVADNSDIVNPITSQEATIILKKSTKKQPKFYLERLYIGDCESLDMSDKINSNNIYYKIDQYLYNIKSAEYHCIDKSSYRQFKIVPLVNAMKDPNTTILSREELLSLNSKIDLTQISSEKEWHFLENLYVGFKRYYGYDYCNNDRWYECSPIILEHFGDYMRDISSHNAFYNEADSQLIDNIIRDYQIFPFTFLLNDDEIKKTITTREIMDVLNQQRDTVPKYFTNKLFMGDYMECGSGSWRYDALYYEIGNKFYDLERGTFVNYDNMCYWGNYGATTSASGMAIPFINALGNYYKPVMYADEALERYNNRDKVQLQKIYTKQKGKNE